MKGSDLTLRYGLIQAIFWMCYAPILAFVSLYLLDCGFSSSLTGVLIAVSGTVSAVLQPIVSGYADRPDSISLKWLNVIVAGATMACGVGLLLFRSSRILTLLFYGAAIALLQISTPLVNALGMNSLNCGSRLNFGAAKGASSISYALVSVVLGKLTAKMGSIVVPVCILIFYMLFLGSIILYPRQKSQVERVSDGNTGFFSFFRKYPRFSLVLAGCIFLFISHVLLNSFTLQIIQTKGGGSEEMGTAMALAAISELPPMLAFSWMLKKAGSHVWLRLSGVFFILKTLGSLLVSGITGFYAVQFLQMGAWALIALSSVYYINAVMEPEDAIKGQGYYTMAYTIGTVIGAIIGGRIIDASGIPALLIFGTVCACAGAVMVACFAQRSRDRGI